MKKTAFVSLSFLVSLASISSAFAADYACKGQFEKKIEFTLRVGRKQAVLKVGKESCKATVDASYRPTAKYAGYSRFVGTKGQFEACKAVMVAQLGKGNSFDSIKVSPELLDGEDQGSVTLVYDFGDYHGQLANEKVGCSNE